MAKLPHDYSDRASRPEAERTDPFREFAHMMQNAGQPSSSSSRARASHGSTDTQSDGDRAQSNANGNFIEDGVRSAYEVIDHYILHGQEIARQFSQPPYTGGGLGGTLGLGGALGATPDMGRLGDIQAKALRTYMDMLGVCFELVGVITSPSRPSSASSSTDGYGGAANATSTPHPQAANTQEDVLQVDDVIYEIRSDRPVRVSATLSPGAYYRRVASHGLRSLEQNLGEIPVEFRTDQSTESLVVAIVVPSETPAGTYTGLALDREGGEILGNVRLDVL